MFSYKFSGHLNSNLFVRAERKICVTELWSRFLVPLINEQLPYAAVQAIKRNISWEECLRQLLSLGAIYKDQRRMQQEFNVDESNVVRIHLLPRRYDVQHIRIDDCSIHEDSDFLVINKPSMVPVHPTLDNLTENILYLLQQERETRLYAVHRLDLETSGVLLLAKNALSMLYLQNLFSHRHIEKFYKAIVSGSGSELGLQRHWIQTSDRSPKVVFDSVADDRTLIELVILNREPFVSAGGQSVDIQLLTGKTHQIRAQMSHLGSPLIGDTLYGGHSFSKDSSYTHFLLHAYKMELVDAKGKVRRWETSSEWIKG